MSEPFQDVLTRNHVRVVGNGNPVLVFGHGFGSDQTAWRFQKEALCSKHRLVLFDHVGAGRSDLSAYSPRRYRSLHSYTQDLLEILDELSIENCVYIGHSMAGMIGLLAALAEPSRFSRLILIGASPRYLNDVNYHGGFEPTDITALLAAMTMNYQAWASGFAGLAMGNKERPELAAEFAATLSAVRPDIAISVSRLIYHSDHRADLPRVKKPTLIIQSKSDIAVPLEVGEYMAMHIPHAELSVMDTQGHFPHISAPQAVLEAIHSFLP